VRGEEQRREIEACLHQRPGNRALPLFKRSSVETERKLDRENIVKLRRYPESAFQKIENRGESNRMTDTIAPASPGIFLFFLFFFSFSFFFSFPQKISVHLSIFVTASASRVQLGCAFIVALCVMIWIPRNASQNETQHIESTCIGPS